MKNRFRETNVEVILGDATALDLPDDSFSAGASFHMLHHIGSDDAQDRAFAELPGSYMRVAFSSQPTVSSARDRLRFTKMTPTTPLTQWTLVIA